MGLLKIINLGKSKLKQEVMLLKALKERGVPTKNLEIKIDHMNGLNYINGIKTRVIYPDSFFDKAESLIPKSKELDYYFNGNMDAEGERDLMLEPFRRKDRTIIVKSNTGRINFLKDRFNKFYYKGLASAKFGLCPNQSNWPGDRDNVWTYRFIECCMVKSLPIIFDKTPLGKNFVDGFHFHSDSKALRGELQYSEKEAQENLKLVRQRFGLTEELIAQIKATIK